MKILLVEDNFLISMQLADLLREEGCEILGPFPTSEGALLALETEAVDGALLDFSLRSGDSTPVAMELLRRECAFAFVTGYQDSTVIPTLFSKARVLTKPVSQVDIGQVLAEFGVAEAKP